MTPSPSPQACRGHALDEGVEVDSAVDDSAAVNLPQHLSIAIDTAVMYATAPGKRQPARCADDSGLRHADVGCICTLIKWFRAQSLSPSSPQVMERS